MIFFRLLLILVGLLWCRLTHPYQLMPNILSDRWVLLLFRLCSNVLVRSSSRWTGCGICGICRILGCGSGGGSSLSAHLVLAFFYYFWLLCDYIIGIFIIDSPITIFYVQIICYLTYMGLMTEGLIPFDSIFKYILFTVWLS